MSPEARQLSSRLPRFPSDLLAHTLEAVTPDDYPFEACLQIDSHGRIAHTVFFNKGVAADRRPMTYCARTAWRPAVEKYNNPTCVLSFTLLPRITLPSVRMPAKGPVGTSRR